MTTCIKMAAAAVFAELKYRNGLRQKISVSVENNLSSLIGGILDLNTNVSRLLSELVEREKTRGDGAGGEEEEEDDDSDEDEGVEDPEKLQPPAKKSKT